MRFLAGGLFVGLLVAGSAFSQYVISSHSGVIQYVEGRAFLGDKPIEPKFGQFPDIKENQEFRTEDGRAEILSLETLGASGNPTAVWQSGEDGTVRVTVRYHDAVDEPVIGRASCRERVSCCV